MMPARRQRNKKKFGTTARLEKPKNATVKVKPKEEEPCSTKNRKPRKLRAGEKRLTKASAGAAQPLSELR